MVILKRETSAPHDRTTRGRATHLAKGYRVRRRRVRRPMLPTRGDDVKFRRVTALSLVAGPLCIVPVASAHASVPPASIGAVPGAPTLRPAPPKPVVPPAPPVKPFVNTYVQHVATKDRVVFLTIDDGIYEDPDFLALVRRQHLPITVFLTTSEGHGARAAYWKELAKAGAVIEDHTLTHPYLTRLSASGRAHEICGAAQQIRALVGRRPTLMRPPYGSWNTDVLASAKGCGLHAVIGWDAVMPQSGQLQTWYGAPVLHPGDIVIMHFLHGLTGQVQRLEQLVKNQHLRFAFLENYV